MVAILSVIAIQAALYAWQDPPGPEDDVVRIQIDLAEKEAGTMGVSLVLANGNSDYVRSYPRFRKAMKDHADSKPVSVVTPVEKGERLELTLDIGAPNQLIYLYQADARGAYGSTGVHFRGDSGDFKYARLFGYGKSGPDGKAVFRTIRPAGCPGSDLPERIHFQVSPKAATVGEIWFSDDARLTPQMRQRGQDEALIVTPERTRDGWKATAKVPLRD